MTLYMVLCDGYRNKLQSRYCYSADNLHLFTFVFSPHQHHKIWCPVKYYYFPKRLSYQFLAFKDLYIQTKLRNKLLKELFHITTWLSIEYWPPHINIRHLCTVSITQTFTWEITSSLIKNLDHVMTV